MTDPWSAYWAGAGQTGCLPGAPEPVQRLLETCWRDWALGLPAGTMVLDLATGAGAVLRTIARHRPDLVLLGVDRASLPPAPPGMVLQGGIDIAALPQANASAGAVSSQFGIEYAGADALAEAARVLAPGGLLRFVVHHAGSEAIRHNRARHAAIAALVEAGLFRLARRELAGLPDPAMARAVAMAVSANRAQSISAELPAALRQALTGPAPAARIAALETMALGERDRLAAMQGAARDRAGAEVMAGALEAAGLRPTVAPLGASAPIAWLIDGDKPR